MELISLSRNVKILDRQYSFTSMSFGHEFIVTSDSVLSSVPTLPLNPVFRLMHVGDCDDVYLHVDQRVLG